MSLDLLRQRDFRLLFGGQVVSLFGDGMVTVALAFAVLEAGGSASAIGLVFAARMLPLVGCLLAGGVVADRVSRRAVMVSADLVRLISQAAIATLLIAGAAEIWMIALLAGVTGAATGFFNPACTGLLPVVAAPELLQQANGLRGTAMAAGEILGPAVAGVLVATAGPGWALAIDSATFGISAAFLTRLRLPSPAVRRNASFLDDLRDGWTAFRSRTWVWTLVLAAGVGNMLWGAWTVLGPVVAERDLGGAAAWGGVLSAIGVGGIAGGVLAMRTKPNRPLVVAAVSFAVFAVPLALLAAGAPLALLMVGALVAGCTLTLGNAVWESTLQRYIPADSLSRVSAYDWFGSLAFYPLGVAIWGPLSVAIGIGVSLWLAAGLVVATMVALVSVADIRHLPPGPSRNVREAEAVR